VRHCESEFSAEGGATPEKLCYNLVAFAGIRLAQGVGFEKYAGVMRRFVYVILGLTAVGASGWWALSRRAAGSGEPAVAKASRTPAPNVAAMVELGEGIELQLGREPEKALEKFAKALELDGSLKGVRYQMAVAAYQAGDVARGRRMARESMSKGEAVADSHILLGTMAGREGDHAEASREFALAVEAAPANAMAYYNWSDSLRSEGKPGEALEKLALAVGRNPGEPLYALKQRLARIEAGDRVGGLAEEAHAQEKLVPPAGDWLLTGAALALARGDGLEAERLLEAARGQMQGILFVGVLQEDPFFRRYRENPAVARYLNVSIQKEKKK